MKQCWKSTVPTNNGSNLKHFWLPVSVFHTAISISLFCKLSWLFSSLKSLPEAPCCSPICQLASCSRCTQRHHFRKTRYFLFHLWEWAALLLSCPGRVSSLPGPQFSCHSPMFALRAARQRQSIHFIVGNSVLCHPTKIGLFCPWGSGRNG